MGIRYPMNINDGTKKGIEYRQVVFGAANAETPIYTMIKAIVKKCTCQVISPKWRFRNFVEK